MDAGTLIIVFLVIPIGVGYAIRRILEDTLLDEQGVTDWYQIKFWSDRHSPGNHMTKTENQRPRHRTATPRAKKKAPSQRTGRYAQLDSLLNSLDDDERVYLERKLGTGELMLGNDGELVTLDEYRRGKGKRK